jgi:hypothetical protein
MYVLGRGESIYDFCVAYSHDLFRVATYYNATIGGFTVGDVAW